MAAPGQRLNTIETQYPLDVVASWILADIARGCLVRAEWDANPRQPMRNGKRRGMSRAYWAHGSKLARMNGIQSPTHEQAWEALVAYALGLTAESVAMFKEYEGKRLITRPIMGAN